MKFRIEFTFYPTVCHVEMLKTAINSILTIAGINSITWTKIE